MKTLLSRANLEAHVASKELGRYAINGIKLAEEGTVSTDGRRLLVVPYPQDDPAEHPVEYSSEADANSYPILPVAAAAKVARNLPKKHPREILTRAVVESTGFRITASTTDLETTDRVVVNSPEVEFPPYAAVIPARGDATARVILDIEYLAGLLAAAKRTGADVVELGLKVNEDKPLGDDCSQNPVRFDFLHSESGEWTEDRHPVGVLMPIAS